jgi:hypothetical protein
MNILTGNDLKSGDVVWWTGKDWSRLIGDAVAVEGDGAGIIAAESTAQRVNAAYAVEADARGIPLHIKDRVRAAGPTVRLDLSINTSIPIVKV